MATLDYLQALGNMKQLPIDMKMAMLNNIDESFKVLPEPNIDDDDWQAIHQEKGQTFNGFKRIKYKAVPDEIQNTIYVQPVGCFDNPRAASLQIINEFACVFFPGCNVVLLTPIELGTQMAQRNKDGSLQYDTEAFLDLLHQTRSRRDSGRELICMAVTMADIYPKEWNWNFVYWLVCPTDRLGICSFSRLDPLFPSSPTQQRDEHSEEPLSEDHRIIILRRTLKLFLASIGYLFGLKHCVYKICLNNGANHEDELDRQELYLCPVCLHKLYSTLDFDVRQMYETLAYLFGKVGLEEEAAWYRKRLDCMRDS